MTVPRTEYERRIARWVEQIARGDQRHLQISNLRLEVAAVGAVAMWQFVRGAWSPVWVLGTGLIFGGLVVAHARLWHHLDRWRRAKRLYERGLDRIDGRWAGAGPDGVRFGVDHAYARDLDLFGAGSLFQLIDTARTEIGEETLADWLRGPAPISEIRARQAGIDELRPMLDFREDVAVLAAEAEVGRTGALATWAAAPPANFSNGARRFFEGCALMTFVLAVLAYVGWIRSSWVVAFVIFHRSATYFWGERIAHVLGGVAMPERDLALVSSVLERIESQRFSSPRLSDLRDGLISAGIPPSKRIAQLRRLVSWVDSTENLMFAPVAYVLLLRPILAVAIDRWHRAYGKAVTAWLQAVGDLEALVALATDAYEHPDDVFPEIVAVGPLFEASALAHPLIVESKCVRNDVTLDGRPLSNHSITKTPNPAVLIVSGSNMSGKSTLLRAVGLNVVLALAGSTVRAASLRISPLAIGATLRIDDSLQEGHSRFCSEILRLRAIVEQASGGTPVLFLLDEVLHGTNSHDRRIGAEAVVRALVARGAIGLVTTHDLALTELETTLGTAAANVHFEDRIENGRMVFDYRMRPGVVTRSNALELMRAIGLEV